MKFELQCIVVFCLGLAAFQWTACVNDPIFRDPVDPGMPPDTTKPVPSPECDPDTLYFEQDILPIVLSSCGMGFCHDSESKSAGIEITSFQTLMESNIVVPFNAEDSRMYQVMASTDITEIMPPSPRGPISDTNILVVMRWIEQGALNNDCLEDDNCAIVDSVSFATQVFPTIDKYCTGCHSGGNPWGGLFLRNYAEVKAAADDGSLFGSVNHDMGFAPMPDNQEKLSQCLIDEIEAWVAIGAPNN